MKKSYTKTQDFIADYNRLRIQAEKQSKWFHWIGTIKEVEFQFKTYGKWNQIMRYPSVDDGGSMGLSKVHEWKYELEKFIKQGIEASIKEKQD